MKNTPRDVILQLGALGALYISLSFLLTLIFGLINVTFPIATDNYWELESATDGIRLGIAMLTVFFPTYIILTRLVYRHRRSEAAVYQGFARWLLYGSLLIGGFVMLITLVTTFYTFLSGDMTLRFLLKAGAITAITLSAFYYYLKDLGDYWITHVAQAKAWGIGVSIFVSVIVVLGFINIETPTEVREMRIDELQVNDLRNIQWQLENYLQTSSTTPETLTALYNDSELVPTAPESRDPYTYEVTESGFKLCATFSRDATITHSMPYIDPNLRIKQSENWNYKAGRHCFERTIK
jgi:hypothetical protein